jgi:hypothetical protein
MIFDLQRASNGAVNHGLRFDDNNDRFSYTYNLGSEYDIGYTVSATTWYLVAMTHSGTGTAVTCYLYSLDGTLLASTNGVSGLYSNDSETQIITYGANWHWDVSNTRIELRGRLCLPLFVRGTALTSAQLSTYASDPLALGDSLLATIPTQVTWFDDSNTDRGPNGETLAIYGGVTLGTANGPTIYSRWEPAPSVVISSVGRKALGILYDGEQRVPVSGAELGTTPPLVQLTTDPNGVSNLVGQSVRSNAYNALTFDCDKGSLNPGALYLKVTNMTVGHEAYQQSAIVQITVRADPGAATVVVRRTVPTFNFTENVAIATFDAADEFYVRSAQEVLTYSVAAGALPTGLSISSTTALISGTIDSGAATGSPYNVTIRATDPNGSYAQQIFSWIVLAEVTPPPPTPTVDAGVGSWGTKGRVISTP